MLFNSAEFVPNSARERLVAPISRVVLRLALKPALSPNIPIPWQRWWLSQVVQSTRPRGRMDVQSGVLSGVPGEWVRPRRLTANTKTRATILYLHGGAYCVGSAATHR